VQNGFVESFNGRMREEFLNKTLSRNLAHARELIADWVTDKIPPGPTRLSGLCDHPGWNT